MLKVYNNNSDKRVLDKNISLVQTFNNVKPYKEINIINPVFLIDFNDSILNCNYCYYDKFDRYYFIDNITILDNNKCFLQCSVDVLMSFKTDIKGLKVVIIRQQNYKMSNIIDSNILIDTQKLIDKYSLKNVNYTFSSSGYNYVLIAN